MLPALRTVDEEGDEEGEEGEEGEGEERRKRKKKKGKKKRPLQLDEDDFDLLEEQGMVSAARRRGALRGWPCAAPGQAMQHDMVMAACVRRGQHQDTALEGYSCMELPTAVVMLLFAARCFWWPA